MNLLSKIRSLQFQLPSALCCLTSRMSSSLMHPGTSLLFLNTSRDAPVSRCEMSVDGTRNVRAKIGHLLQQKPFQFLPAVIDSFPVHRIHHPDQRVCLLEVILPVCAQRLLATDVPWRRSASVEGRWNGKLVQIFSLYLSFSISIFSSNKMNIFTYPS